MQFGGTADATASAEMFTAARAAGITHFDTAFIYTDGASEEILGKLIKAERDDLFIATKIAYQDTPDVVQMRADFEMSLHRLNDDRVDLLYLHRDPGDALAPALDWLCAEQSAGRIGQIGLSNFSAWRAMKALAMVRDRGGSVGALQPMYNLVKRQAEVEILPFCAAEGVTAVPYSPLGGGLLTGKYASGETGRLTTDARYAARYADPAMAQTATALTELARETGIAAATLAAAWAAHHPARPVPILSARSAAQLAPSLAAMDLKLDDALYARLSALSPTPPPATDRTEEAG